jgi:hypothetical protein
MQCRMVDRIVLAAAAQGSWWNHHSGIITLVGVIVTFVGVLVTLIIYLLQRDKKTFDWQLLTDEQIVTRTAREARGGITVLWDNTVELTHPRLLTIRLMNTGKREIRPEDFDGDTVITADATMDIQSAYIVRRHEGMRHEPDCAWTTRECNVKAILYNRGDWVDVQLVLDHDITHLRTNLVAVS